MLPVMALQKIIKQTLEIVAVLLLQYYEIQCNGIHKSQDAIE